MSPLQQLPATWTLPVWIARYDQANSVLHVTDLARVTDVDALVLFLAGTPSHSSWHAARGAEPKNRPPRLPCGVELPLDQQWWRAHPEMLTDPTWRRCPRCLDLPGVAP